MSCLFCRREGDRTVEHLLSECLRRHLPAAVGPYEVSRSRSESGGPLTTEFSYSEVQLEGLKGGDYCQACNNGWMQELDCAVEGPVGRMIKGKTTWLSPAEQLLVATWATKVALVWESTQGQQRSVPDTIYRAFYRDRRPLSGYPVDLARSTAREAWYRCYARAQGEPADDAHAAEVEFVLETLVAGEFVAHVVLPGPAPKTFEQTLPGSWWISIWPRSWRRECWPPSHGLDEEAFAEILPATQRAIDLG